MKFICSVFAFTFIATLTFAQNNVNLHLHHEFEGSTFSYGTTFQTLDGTAISLERVQYYICGVEITHDGNQVTPLTDQYILASGNITSYDLGMHSISSMEGLKFDFGVDEIANGQGITNWPSGHPLGPQTPSMDWSWPFGYFFFVLDGMIDNTGDGVPNQVFSLHGVGDDLFRTVVMNDVTPSESGNELNIHLSVNIADWLKNIELPTVGVDHGTTPNNIRVANNTNNETVFTYDETASTDELSQKQTSIYADYSMPYAPTIYYQLPTTSPVQINVYDMNGSIVLSDEDQPFDGNYFIRKELNSGSYLISFSNGELEERFHFIVRK